MNFQTQQYREIAFATPRVQDIKLSVHDRYSRIPIDMHGEVVRALQLQGDESIVDIGCGTGLFLKYLRGQRGHTGPLVGVDFSAGIMEGIRAICQAEGLNIGFSVCDAETLCFSDSTVDAVSLQHMLSYVPDMDRACKEAGRICKRGGSCVFTANAMRNYPHIRKYRELAAKLLGWPMIEVNTSRFCVEVMDKVLSPHFSQVNITVHEGLLHLPADEFVRWFTSMLDNWHPLPNAEQRQLVLEHLIHEWLPDDLDDGWILEPKWVGVAACKPH